MGESRQSRKPALCVINRNGGPYLEETLRTALASEESFSEFLLVDDASTDGSVAFVRERFPRFRVIRNETCVGPAGARNRGFAATGADRVLFLDNDVSLGDRCADLLDRALDENEKAALAMPRILYASAPETIQYDGAASHFSGLMTLFHENRPVEGAPRETIRIDSIVTACFLVDRRRFGAGPLFDESFFIYLEDHDLGLRARVRGLEILAVRSASCLHREGTRGLSIRISGRYARRRIESNIRNRWQVVWKSYSARTLVLLTPFFLLYESGQLLIVLKKGWFPIWFGSLFWLGRRFPTVLRERRRIQSERKTPDREILSGGDLPTRRELAGSRLERHSLRMLNRFSEFYWRGISRLL